MFTPLSYSRRALAAAAAVLTTAAALTACSSSDDQAAPTSVVTVTADTPTTTSKAAPSTSAKPATSSAKTTGAATSAKTTDDAATDAAPASGSCDLSEFQAINSHINHVTTCNGKFADAGRMHADMVLYFEFVDGAWQQIPAAGENLDGMSMACYDVDALKRRGLPTSIAERMAQCDPDEYYDPAAHNASAASGDSCTSADGYDISLDEGIGCQEAADAFSYYKANLSDAEGNALNLDFDGWNCASPTYARSQELNAGAVCNKNSGGQALLHNL